ncbi:TIR domain-containing protein [Frankia gtarii]|uniref:TIR domain-containing protein n=1 Tax=Frankia gtarii TaxID=2950102 RepID=UPI0021C1CAD9|nr:TIR domain-containing protein [Frankia gtarii]
MGRWNFFLSYAAEDRQWAEWLAWQLESAHYRVLIRAWDFVPGSNWSLHIQQGVVGAERTIVVLSSAYLRSLDDTPEWQAAFAADPSGAGRRLLPVRVEDCELPGLLKQLTPIDLFDQPVDAARATLITLVRQAIDGRAKPTVEPAFPAPASTRQTEPAFPAFRPTERAPAPARTDDRPAAAATSAATTARRSGKVHRADGPRRPAPLSSACAVGAAGAAGAAQLRLATMLAARPATGGHESPPASTGPAPHGPGGSWAALPTDRLIRLARTVEPAVRAALDPLPADAPAVIGYRPAVRPSLAACQLALLADLESVAVTLFPDWLPGAEVIESAGGAGVAAVRALAGRAAATIEVFGPYLADLAERALRATPTGMRPFTPEVRAAGVARVIAAGFGRDRLALLVNAAVPAAHSRDQRTVHDTLAWFAYTGHVGVWLTGLPDGPAADRIRTLPCPASRHPDAAQAATSIPATPAATGVPAPAGGDAYLDRVALPGVVGRPHPASRAEKRLEGALRARAWAHGRAWNQPYRSGPLTGLHCLDLMWPAERVVIEVDGPEHRGVAHYASDRRRDAELVLEGFTVLRFTNDQVLDDVDAVTSQIERCVETRRKIPKEA